MSAGDAGSIIDTEEQLEDFLSQPSEADRAALAALEGDLLILGAAGKMGPSLVRRAKRAAPGKRVYAVARSAIPKIETLSADLLDRAQLANLPDAPNVIFMAGRKFGSTGNEPLTWATNALLPALVAERFAHSRIVAFSTGNVYPFVAVTSGGATEETATAPVGEYAQSTLARERMFEYFSARNGTPVTILRLNYAIDLRYGVLLDIGRKVFERRPIDLTMGYVNVIWQGDANSACLRSLALCESPPRIFNLTGPETLSVRSIAQEFGEHFGREPVFEGVEAETALLSNASKLHALLGPPAVSVAAMIGMVAHWIERARPSLDKPTHFETRSGRF
jgi:nucleoside-diphosphate-sugar epimerase